MTDEEEKPPKPDPDEKTPREKADDARGLREKLKEEYNKRSHKKGDEK